MTHAQAGSRGREPGPGPSRRSVLRTAGALLPALVLGFGGGGTAAAAVEAGVPRAAGAGAAARVRGAFSAPGYAWPAAGAGGPAGAPATGVVFALTADGRPLAGRRVRFSLGAFHAARPALWFEVSEGRKSAGRHGYLDLDTDAEGTVVLDPWLRHGALPTTATGTHPVVRAQLVGSETLLASAHLSVS
ncbi:hypothetical protein ACFVZH_15660 [Streptomyces sp. NPDC059534]|uniref:hypothetical protein n=1 Tax=Streptomyces sp. NPDC059534 TaxID=3346859 RepID=UPI0036B9BCF4